MTDPPHHIPLPDKPLGDHCSALVNNTLYTFSESAFQSLSLTTDSTWQALPLAFGVKGAACVHAPHREDPSQDSLYIVGGRSSNETMIPENGYMGIQKYTFATKKWEIITTPSPIAYNVTGHGAVYMRNSTDLLMFSGVNWPDESTPSSQTFLIQTRAPYYVTAVPADEIPPLLGPVVLPWGDNGALIMAGSDWNTKMYTFTEGGTGWAELGMALAAPLPPRDRAGATLAEGDDGSRMLFTFDVSQAPIKFSQTQVKSENRNTRRGTLDARELTANNWPQYDGKLEPKRTLTGISMAYDANTMVISGGDEESPLCIFNMRKNSWEDPTQLLLGPNADDDRETSPDADSPITTESPVPGPPAPPPREEDDGLSRVQILLIVFGVVLVLLIILGTTLFFLRQRKIRNNSKLGRSNTKRSRMSFQDRGLSFHKEIDGGMASIQSVHHHQNPSISSSISHAHPGQQPQKQGPGNRGWSKYFSGSSATNLIKLPTRSPSQRTQTTTSFYDDRPSVDIPPYSSQTRYPYGSRGSDVAQPADAYTPGNTRSQGLVLDLPGHNLGVHSGHFNAARRSSQLAQQQQQPTHNHHHLHHTHLQNHHRRSSTASSVSSIDNHDGLRSEYSSGIPDSFVGKPPPQTWDVMGNNSRTNVSSVGSNGVVGLGEVRGSPRGWGVLTRDDRASSVYPESAVTVDPEDDMVGWRTHGGGGAGGGGGSKMSDRFPMTNHKDDGDVSWLNLKA